LSYKEKKKQKYGEFRTAGDKNVEEKEETFDSYWVR